MDNLLKQARKVRDMLKEAKLPFVLAFFHTFDDKSKPLKGFFSMSGGEGSVQSLLHELEVIRQELFEGERKQRSGTFKAQEPEVEPYDMCSLKGGSCG